MFPSETRVLIIVPQEVVDRARAFAGRATAATKLPVSLQIVFRALIDEGLKRSGDPALMANIARQAETVRRIRSEARRSSSAKTTGRRTARLRSSAVARRSS
jgi:hypothetical protein